MCPCKREAEGDETPEEQALQIAEVEIGVMCLKEGRRGHKPRNAGSP